MKSKAARKAAAFWSAQACGERLCSRAAVTTLSACSSVPVRRKTEGSDEAPPAARARPPPPPAAGGGETRGGARGGGGAGAGARAQNGVDRNVRVGSGGINPARPDFAAEVRLRNAIVTGNAPGGISFRGDVGYRAPGEFMGSLGSNDSFAFRRDSYYSGLGGLGIRGTDALQYQFAMATGHS